MTAVGSTVVDLGACSKEFSSYKRITAETPVKGSFRLYVGTYLNPGIFWFGSDTIMPGPEGKPVRKEVKIGETGNEGIEIVEGLAEGEQVVVAELDLKAMRETQQKMIEAQQGGGLAGGQMGGPRRPTGGGSGGRGGGGGGGGGAGARPGGGGSR